MGKTVLMENDTVVSVSQLDLKYGATSVFEGLNLNISRGENWLLGGESGSGKSSLGKAIAGIVEIKKGEVQVRFLKDSKLPKLAYFVDNWYNFTDLDGDRNFYYQQRYNQHASTDTLTVYGELLKFGMEMNLDFAKVEPLLKDFGYENCRLTQLIELSSGEHKKLQLVKALWLKPQLLILDEPYTGLDKYSRGILNDTLDSEVREGVTVIILSNSSEIPRSINRFAKIHEGKLRIATGVSDMRPRYVREKKAVPFFLQKFPMIDSQTMVDMHSVSVKYGDKTVLNNVSWKVNAGEKWALRGANGSGKSTLLSLIDGDHPQAYANDITLFGRKRGSGESIWDIKEKIGIISPEMHCFFDRNATVWNAIASGFYDSIGWFLNVSDEERRKMNLLLDFFGLTEEKDRLLNILPLGKQRLALLARTIIKNPQLLILDEPCQGLDAEQTGLFNSILDELSVFGKTIIYVGHYESQMPSCLEHSITLSKGKVVDIH